MADGKRRHQGQQQSHSPACSLPHHEARQSCPPGHQVGTEGLTPRPLALGTHTNKGEHLREIVLKLQDIARPLETLLNKRQSRGAGRRWLSTVS